MAKSLLELPVPTLNPEQLTLIEQHDLRATREGSFNLQEATNKLQQHTGQKVIGIDIGGDKAITQLFEVTPNGLIPNDAYADIQHDDDGHGYLESLERTAAFAKLHDIPIGMSIGIPLHGAKPAEAHKLPALVRGLAKYSNDFTILMPSLKALLNDGPAGIISGAIQANLATPHEIDQIVYVINGGGIGTGVLKNHTLTATEAGHTPVLPQLNIYRETRPCGVFGATHVCIELTASNEKGIEPAWKRKTGHQLSAKAIEHRFTRHGEHGDLALELYNYSALMVAHVAKGLAGAFDIDLTSPRALLVGHGGAFKFPDYGSRIKQILDVDAGRPINLLLTNSYTQNACLDGAALRAITV